MNSGDNTWVKAIRHYVYEMLVLLIALILIASAFNTWNQRASKQISDLINNYHLTCNSLYLSAMEELRLIQGHLNLEMVSKKNDELNSRQVFTNERDFDYRIPRQIINRDISQGLELEHSFADSNFSDLAAQLKKRIKQFDQQYTMYIENNLSPESMSQYANALSLTLKQILRLHSSERLHQIKHLEDFDKRQTTLYYLLLMALLIAGIFITRKGMHAIQKVIDKHRSDEKQIIHQAHFDSLTDLPNRFFLLERLSKSLKEAKNNDNTVAVLFMDLDDFKKINDSLGHNFGDKILIEAATRLNSVIGDQGTIGRMGGDEFLVILEGNSSSSDISSLVKSLIEEIRKPFIIDYREMVITVSIGICIAPDDGYTADELFRNADTAMYYSKNIGRNTSSFFTAAMNRDISRKLEVEEHMRGALERNEFYVVYQPQVDLNTHKLFGAEALLRWNSRTLGEVSPVEFIPVAEQTGMIVAIGKFVLFEALRQTSFWQMNYHPSFRIAVNLSPRQFRDPNLIDQILDALQQNHIANDRLELEITEGVLISGHRNIELALRKLDRMGVQLAMDDFGTGYSSLSYLRKYPFDVVKVDRSFVKNITANLADEKLIKTSVAMAHALNLKVIAEGVETGEQLTMLKKYHCDFAQGFWLGRPMKANDISSLIESNQYDSQLSALHFIS